MITAAMHNTDSAGLTALADQFPSITVNALNRTAFAIRTAEQDSMRSVFDRPTPWTLNQVFVRPATVEHPIAFIGTSIAFSTGPAETILSPHIYGGSREPKRVESRMIRTGLLPKGWFIAPGKFMPIDQFGNPVSDELIEMLSWLGALEMGNRNPASASKRRNKTQRAGARYMLAYPGRTKLPPGIYQRNGNKTLMMLAFVQQIDYQVRLPWFETAQKVIDEVFEKKIRSEIYKAMGT